MTNHSSSKSDGKCDRERGQRPQVPPLRDDRSWAQHLRSGDVVRVEADDLGVTTANKRNTSEIAILQLSGNAHFPSEQGTRVYSWDREELKGHSELDRLA